MIVIRIAITPSLNASTRPFGTSERLPGAAPGSLTVPSELVARALAVDVVEQVVEVVGQAVEHACGRVEVIV